MFGITGGEHVPTGGDSAGLWARMKADFTAFPHKIPLDGSATMSRALGDEWGTSRLYRTTMTNLPPTRYPSAAVPTVNTQFSELPVDTSKRYFGIAPLPVVDPLYSDKLYIEPFIQANPPFVGWQQLHSGRDYSVTNV